MGHAGSFSYDAEFSFFFFSYREQQQCQESVRACTYESEIVRQNRVRIGRLSDREAGKSADSLPCVLSIHPLRGFTEGCYSLPFSTDRSVP